MGLEPFPLQPGVSMHIPAGCTLEPIALKHRNSGKINKIKGANGRAEGLSPPEPWAAPERGSVCPDKAGEGFCECIVHVPGVGVLGCPREGAALAGCVQQDQSRFK